MSNLKIFDISPEISPKTAVFPGDTPFTRNESMSFKKGNHLTLSSISTTVHIGAHTDAPNHYHKNGEDIASRMLEFYCGPCQVIEVTLGPKERIYPKHIENIKIVTPRILFKTESFPNPNQWNDNFNALSKELVEYLAKNKVILAGIDTPSVDISDDQNLESHQTIYQNNMAILEGITLQDIDPGEYNLIALPLKIKNADASPVRAVLLKGSF